MLRTLILLLLLPAGCSSVDPPPDGDLNVLFVGNSLTYTNDLPAMVAAFAEADGLDLVYRTVARPNVSLADHWLEGTARGVLEEGGWDWVVLQQGPSSLPENQEHLRAWAVRWAEQARAHGTEPALMMVWPAAHRAHDFPAVAESYAAAAAAVAGRLLPAGDTWRGARSADPSVALYAADGLHPSEAGTYAAAVTVYAGLTGASPLGRPSTLSLPGREVRLPVVQARLLQRAAAAALAAHGAPEEE